MDSATTTSRMGPGARVSFAGLLTLLLPGLGHVMLGERKRGLVLMVTVAATFWTGIALGGVHTTVDARERKLWLLAQLGNTGQTLAVLGIQKAVKVDRKEAHVMAATQWRAVDLGVHYTGVAGLLNLLVVLDAIARADASRRRKGLIPQPVGAGP